MNELKMNELNDWKTPYTVLQVDGIYHYPVKSDGSKYLAPIRLSDPFNVAGFGIDEGGTYFHVISYDNNQQRCIIPRGEVGTNEGWRKLRNYINIPSSRRKLDLLTDYIQENCDDELWQITDLAGWHQDAYIFPNGEIIGNNDRLYFNGKISHNKKIGYQYHGSIKGWQKSISRYAANNSRLCLMLGAAFAAPLLRWFNIDGGIFHLYGSSSSGKSTAQRIAQSVWGSPDTGENWNTTALAALNNAVARHDGLLSIDEIGEDESGRNVERSIYSLANGKSRALGTKEGGNRPEIRFRVFTISSGETSLEAHLLKHGRVPMAGQLVRCPSIFHKLECHHDFSNFRIFTDHLNESVYKHYGVAGREFIQKIMIMKTSINAEVIQARFQNNLELLRQFKSKNGQLQRTAKLFAAAMTGLELACEWNISGFGVDKAKEGIVQCYQDWWHQQPEEESYEAARIRRKSVEYIQINKHLFKDPEFSNTSENSFPGYVHRTDEDEEDIYYVFPKVFRECMTDGFDENKAKEILHEMGWLQKQKDNRWVRQLYGKSERGQRTRLGYFLVFVGIDTLN